MGFRGLGFRGLGVTPPNPGRTKKVCQQGTLLTAMIRGGGDHEPFAKKFYVRVLGFLGGFKVQGAGDLGLGFQGFRISGFGAQECGRGGGLGHHCFGVSGLWGSGA